MKRIRKAVISGAAFAALFCGSILLTSCDRKPEEIRIGLIVYNDQDVERLSTINAAAMAVDTLNNSGGLILQGRKKSVVIVREDVQSAVPEKSVEAVQKLINQRDVVAIIGPQYSIDAIPSGEIAERSRIPLISPISTNPRTTLNRKYVFRMGFLDDFQGRVAARFIQNDLGLERFSVLYNLADPYSRGIAGVFKNTVVESGKGAILAFESYTTDETDLTPQLASIRDARPDVLYLPNISQETERIATKAREMGIDALFMGGDGWDRTAFSKMQEFQGAYMTAHYSAEIQTLENRAFVSEYESRYGIVPGDTAALTYDAFNMVLEVIRGQGKADPASIRDGLYSMGPFTGVAGKIDFIDTGDPRKGAVILNFSGGKIVYEGPVEEY